MYKMNTLVLRGFNINTSDVHKHVNVSFTDNGYWTEC